MKYGLISKNVRMFSTAVLPIKIHNTQCLKSIYEGAFVYLNLQVYNKIILHDKQCNKITKTIVFLIP